MLIATFVTNDLFYQGKFFINLNVQSFRRMKESFMEFQVLRKEYVSTEVLKSIHIHVI